MAPKEASAPQVQTPDSQTEGEPVDQSPLASEPVRKTPRKGNKKAEEKVRVREYDVPRGDLEQDGHGHGHTQEDVSETSSFVDESPLAALAESQIALCHVERCGPGTGPGWCGGMLFDYGDGRGPVAISKGPVGTFQKTADLFDVVVAEAGGGRYRFTTKGQLPVEQPLPGPPLPLPMERGTQPYPNGAMPNSRGGFDRGWDQGQGQQGPQGLVDPADDPNFDPSQGISPEQFAQTGINGWQFNAATGRWIFYSNGMAVRPPRGSRPPSFHGMGMGGGIDGFSPGEFDHSGGDRVSRLEKLVEKLLEAPKEDPRIAKLEAFLEKKSGNDALATMMANQIQMQSNAMTEAQRARDHEFKMAELRQKNEETERKAKAIADAGAAVELKKLELAAITAKADAEKVAAQENSKAVQANATAAIASNERIAQIQADANKQVLAAVTQAANKNDGVEIMTKGMQLMADMNGQKGTVEAISQAAEKLIPTMVDGYVAVKTMGPQQGGQPGQQQQGQVGSTDDEMVARMVHLITVLFHKNTPPADVPKMIGSACVVSNFPPEKLDPLIALGSPTVIGAYLQSAAEKVQDEEQRKKLLGAKEALTSEKGKVWFNAVRQAFSASRKGSAQAPPQVPTAPPPPQVQGPGPATPGK